MYRTRNTELLIRTSFVAALALLAAIVVTGYVSLARGIAVAEELIIGASVLALGLVLLSILALRRDYLGRSRAEAELDRFFDLSLDFLVISSVEGYFKRVSPAVAFACITRAATLFGSFCRRRSVRTSTSAKS